MGGLRKLCAKSYASEGDCWTFRTRRNRARKTNKQTILETREPVAYFSLRRKKSTKQAGDSSPQPRDVRALFVQAKLFQKKGLPAVFSQAQRMLLGYVLTSRLCCLARLELVTV